MTGSCYVMFENSFYRQHPNSNNCINTNKSSRLNWYHARSEDWKQKKEVKPAEPSAYQLLRETTPAVGSEPLRSLPSVKFTKDAWAWSACILIFCHAKAPCLWFPVVCKARHPPLSLFVNCIVCPQFLWCGKGPSVSHYSAFLPTHHLCCWLIIISANLYSSSVHITHHPWCHLIIIFVKSSSSLPTT